jgi:hypothetical protein
VRWLAKDPSRFDPGSRDTPVGGQLGKGSDPNGTLLRADVGYGDIGSRYNACCFLHYLPPPSSKCLRSRRRAWLSDWTRSGGCVDNLHAMREINARGLTCSGSLELVSPHNAGLFVKKVHRG